MATSLSLMLIGALLPLTPVGTYFGFVPLPLRFYLILAAMVVAYLAMVELAKIGFYRWYRAAEPGVRRHQAMKVRLNR